MALLRFLKPKSSLPSATDTGLGETTTKEANAAVGRVLQEQSQPTGGRTRKRKVYTSFSDERAEHGDAAAVKKFKGDFEHGLGESTARYIHVFDLNQI